MVITEMKEIKQRIEKLLHKLSLSNGYEIGQDFAYERCLDIIEEYIK